MKCLLIATALMCMFSSDIVAQKFAGLDKSPMDIAYYPNNFAHDRKPGDKAIIRVTYSRPAAGGRDIFGKLVPYGEVWRAGANEATEIKFYKDVELAGKVVKAGTYALFATPTQNDWTIILNSDLDFWGSYSYNKMNDIIQVTVPVKQLNTVVENFTIQFDKKDDNGIMMLAWDKTMVEVPFKVLD